VCRRGGGVVFVETDDRAANMHNSEIHTTCNIRFPGYGVIFLFYCSPCCNPFNLPG